MWCDARRAATVLINTATQQIATSSLITVQLVRSNLDGPDLLPRSQTWVPRKLRRQMERVLCIEWHASRKGTRKRRNVEVVPPTIVAPFAVRPSRLLWVFDAAIALLYVHRNHTTRQTKPAPHCLKLLTSCRAWARRLLVNTLWSVLSKIPLGPEKTVAPRRTRGYHGSYQWIIPENAQFVF